MTGRWPVTHDHPISCPVVSTPSGRALQQGRLDGLVPRPGPGVIGAKAGAELPVGEAEAEPAGLAAHPARPPRPRLEVGLAVGAELAQEDRPVVLLAPGGGPRKRLGDRLALVLAAGPLPPLPLRRVLRP